MLKYLPEVAIFGALFLSLLNVLAAAFGLGPALTWATGLPFWVSISTPLAFVGIGILIYSWINSLMSNFSGMAIYFVNVMLAPFGYELLGLPYLIGLAIAATPLPFYSGLRWLSEKFD
ncbi:hypothetical protein H0484_09975 [Pusillimonas sp. CC-YST705]|uniref:Uncharacterized protein n=1 Tax=Mesopusillimonas faecipullorum TaxID=2755040 RepID=A0ABS8CDG0_9BURK|nr:hypothetical protein [Mesopusillimonas faecipullorum]MCB5364073.1 hypothetical protein [Mesopusillimonas faecipullorum]